MYGIVKMKSFERVETNVKSEVILIDKLISKVSSIITQKRIEAAIKALAASEGSEWRNNLTKGKDSWVYLEAEHTSKGQGSVSLRVHSDEPTCIDIFQDHPFQI